MAFHSFRAAQPSGDLTSDWRAYKRIDGTDGPTEAGDQTVPYFLSAVSIERFIERGMRSKMRRGCRIYEETESWNPNEHLVAEKVEGTACGFPRGVHISQCFLFRPRGRDTSVRFNVFGTFTKLRRLPLRLMESCHGDFPGRTGKKERQRSSAPPGESERHGSCFIALRVFVS